MVFHWTAVLYMGTGCDPKFMKEVEEIMRAHGFNVRSVRISCWTKRKDNSLAYYATKDYNVQSGKWDLAIGHSAGGFVAHRTDASIKLAINPFFTEYHHYHKVLHADRDWLAPTSHDNLDNVIMYDGEHSTVPKEALNALLNQIFPIEDATASSQERFR